MKIGDTNSWLGAALALSVLAHVLTYLALGNVSLARVREELATLDFEIADDEPPLQELPEPEPAPEPEVEPVLPEPAPAPPVVRAPEPDPEVNPEPPPPAEETPVAFDNVTLTNDGESSFAMQQSSGIDREGPIGRPGAQVTGRSREGTSGGTPDGVGTGPVEPRVVAIGNLSRSPSSPNNVASFLQQCYPQEERRQGVTGVTRLRLRINPDGSIRFLRTLSSSSTSFTNACRHALERAGNWRPPLDQSGQPVATVVDFTCEFEVDEW